MSNGMFMHIEGKPDAIHNAWIKANSGSKSTGSDDVDVPPLVMMDLLHQR